MTIYVIHIKRHVHKCQLKNKYKATERGEKVLHQHTIEGVVLTFIPGLQKLAPACSSLLQFASTIILFVK